MSVEKKLKALQALKKSQELATKYNSQYNLSVSSIPEIGCDIGGKQVVIGKLKKKLEWILKVFSYVISSIFIFCAILDKLYINS